MFLRTNLELASVSGTMCVYVYSKANRWVWMAYGISFYEFNHMASYFLGMLCIYDKKCVCSYNSF